MRRPGLVLPVLVVVLWVLLFFLLDDLTARKEGPQWMPTGMEWRVTICGAPSLWRRPGCS